MARREELGSYVLVVGGEVYDRVLSLNLKVSKEEATCSGTFVLSWPGAEQFNMPSMVAPTIMDGASGAIILDGQLAATIILDTRISKGTPKQYELTIQFRGKASVLVDSSPNHETGQENQKKASDIMQKLMEGFGVQLVDQSGGTGNEMIKRFILAEGETVERAARRVAREQSLMFWENPQGNWVLEGQNGGTGGSGQALVLGKNFTQWSVKRDVGPRFAKVAVFGNGIPDDDNYGEKNENLFDQGNMPGMLNQYKSIRAMIDGHHTKQSLTGRRKFEGNRRSGQGMNVTLRMSTWSDDSGKLWTVGTKHPVTIPVDQVDGTLELFEVEYELTPDSRSATLVLVGDGVTGGAGNVLMDQWGQAKANEQQEKSPGPEETLTAEQLAQRRAMDRLRRKLEREQGR